MMKTASKKAKGRALCIWFRERILETFKEVNPNDIKITSSGAAGEDIHFSSMVRDVLPFQIESKNLARFSGYAFMDQAVTHGPHTAIVLVKANNRQPLIMLDAQVFLDLCKEAHKGRQ